MLEVWNLRSSFGHSIFKVRTFNVSNGQRFFLCHTAIFKRDQTASGVAVRLRPDPEGEGFLLKLILECRRLSAHLGTGLEPLWVGHSRCGLASRSWLATLNEDVAARQNVITIGSPHHGTALAAWAYSPAALQMRMGSDFLQTLNARDTPAGLSRMTCYWSVCDNVVFPAHSATLAGARSLWQYLALAAATGCASAIGAPSGRALTPALVPTEILPGALAVRR